MRAIASVSVNNNSINVPSVYIGHHATARGGVVVVLDGRYYCR
jgi:hypothetical protein